MTSAATGVIERQSISDRMTDRDRECGGERVRDDSLQTERSNVRGVYRDFESNKD